jgi:hypothetical protein
LDAGAGLLAPDFVDGLVEFFDDMKSVENLQSLGEIPGLGIEVGLPHVRTDKADARAELGAENLEEEVEGFLCAVVADPQKPLAVVVDLIDQEDKQSPEGNEVPLAFELPVISRPLLAAIRANPATALPLGNFHSYSFGQNRIPNHRLIDKSLDRVNLSEYGFQRYVAHNRLVYRSPFALRQPLFLVHFERNLAWLFMMVCDKVGIQSIATRKRYRP